MDQIAFVFAGQGAQYSGMGQELYHCSSAAKALYEEAERLRPGTMQQSFSGTEEELKQTKNTQPCLYLVDLAAALALEEQGIRASATAGFSLGEIAALAYAGAYTPAEGFQIVTQRGLYMQQASEEQETAMVAVLKLDNETIERLCDGIDHVYPVNYNCPGQTVIAGTKTALAQFKTRAADLKCRLVDLPVSGGFHSPFMNSAAAPFAKALQGFSLRQPRMPVYANYTAEPYGAQVADWMEKQITSPVKWQETVERMLADGIGAFIEVGAGKTLSGLIKKTSKDARVYNVQDEASLRQTVEALKMGE